MKPIFALFLSFFISIILTGCTQKTETKTRIPAKLIIDWEEIIEQKIDWSKTEFHTNKPIAPEILQQFKSIGDFKISTKIIVNKHESKQIHTLEFLREIPIEEVTDLLPKIVPMLKNQKVQITHKGAEVTTKKTSFMGKHVETSTKTGPVMQIRND
jgi:hypothetical protein